MAALKSAPLYLRRLVALGLLLICLVAVGLLVGLPIKDAYERYDQSIAELELRLARLDRMAKQRVELEQRLATLRRASAQNRNFLAGDSPALAAATLQQVIKDAITDAGGSVVSAQVLAPVAEKHLQRIALKLRMTGDIGAMQRSLYAIESVRPLMFVDSLDITSSRKRARRGKTVDGSVPLRATLEISGYRRVGGS